MKKHIYDMWVKWNQYGETQISLARQYGVPKKVISYIVNARNKSEAYKRYKKLFMSV
jgi:hypothetical protein